MIDNVTISPASSIGKPEESSEDPVDVLMGGSATVTLPANDPETMDPTAYPLDQNKDLIIAFNINERGGRCPQGGSSRGGCFTKMPVTRHTGRGRAIRSLRTRVTWWRKSKFSRTRQLNREPSLDLSKAPFLVTVVGSRDMATTSLSDADSAALMVGLDVGSTTVKAVCIDPATRRILWSDYQRHESRQAEKAFQLLMDLTEALGSKAERTRIFVTGSGAKTLAEPLGAEFVQEVNAVSLAVESLHPDAGSVIELGGQDAKIIIFKTNPDTGEKQAVCSMNDKCASGTGATIDKCSDQGWHVARGTCHFAFRQFEVAQSRGQVRRVCRDRHRQPRQVRHSLRRGDLLTGGRDRFTKPGGVDAW